MSSIKITKKKLNYACALQAEHRHNGFQAVQKLCNVSSNINNRREIRKARQPNQCNAQAQLVHRETVRGTLRFFY